MITKELIRRILFWMIGRLSKGKKVSGNHVFFNGTSGKYETVLCDLTKEQARQLSWLFREDEVVKVLETKKEGPHE